MALGVTVTTRTAPPGRGAPSQTDTLFVVGVATTGSLTAPTLVRSMADFEAAYGVRSAGNQNLYDGLDAFFREGGLRAYVQRYTAGAGAAATALGQFSANLGPGQVAAWDETPSAATYGILLDHAAANNRFALLDVTNGEIASASITLGGAIPVTNETYGALFAPWVTIPAPAGVVGGTSRQVPASAIVAALCARAEQLGNPNRAPAGRDFPLQYATGFVTTYTDTERTSLSTAGVNTFANVYGVLELYGFVTGQAVTPDSPYWQANASRCRMYLVAAAKVIGEDYMFKPIDGRGLLAAALKSALDGMCKRLYDVNALYGATPNEAYATNVGVAVNTVNTIAQGELHAVVEARLSLHARSVMIDLVTVPIGQAVTPH